MAEDDAPPVKAAKGIGGRLTKKLGPLPIWAWAAGGAAAAFLVYRFIQSRNASSSSTASTTTPTDLAAGTSSTPGSNGYQDNGQLTQLSTQLSEISDLIQQTPKGPSAAATTTQGYSAITPTQWKANVGNIYQQLTPGVFTKYTGAVSLLKSPGFVPVNGYVAGAGGSASPVGGTAGAPSPVTSGPVGAPNLQVGASSAPLVGGPAQPI
jgi:hypothetical protein